MNTAIPTEYIERCSQYLEDNDIDYISGFEDSDAEDEGHEDEHEDEDEHEEHGNKIVRLAHAHHHYMLCLEYCRYANDLTSQFLFNSVQLHRRWGLSHDKYVYYNSNEMRDCAGMTISPYREVCCHKRFVTAIPKTILQYDRGFSLDDTGCRCHLLRVN